MSNQDRLSKMGAGRRAAALFKAMSTDILLREQFVTNPAQVIAEYVQEERLPAEQAAAINLLIYAVMANRGMFVWLRRYALARHRTVQEPAQFLRDFSRAVVQHRAYHVPMALFNGAAALGVETHDLSWIVPSIIGAFGPGPDGGIGAETFDGGPITGKTIFTIGGTVPGTNDTLDLTGGTIEKTGFVTGGDTLSWLTISQTYWTFDGTSPGTGTGTDVGTGTSTGTGTGDTGTGETGTGETGTGETGTGETGTGETGTGETGTGETGTGETGTGETGTGETGTGETGTGETGTGETGATGTGDNNVLGDLGFSTVNYAVITLITLAQYANQVARAGILDGAVP